MIAAAMLVSCQKELSFEAGASAPNGTAEGTLGGTPGTCANLQFIGIYGAGMAVPDTNALQVEVTFAKAGTYTISTDTCNGLSFKGSGIVTTVTGIPQTVVLKAFGTPTAAGSCNFTVNFKGSICSAPLLILPVAPATTGDYFPTTVGSNWSYSSSEPAAAPDDTAYTFSTNFNATILSNVYRLFTTEDAINKDSSYYRKTGNEYRQFGDIDVVGVASNFVNADYIFLKDDVPVGTTWETSLEDAIISGTPAKMKLGFTIVAKNVDVVVDNKIFRNVIKVGTTSFAGPAGGPFVTVTSYETWFAKGIGIINVAAPLPIYGFYVSRYSVN